MPLRRFSTCVRVFPIGDRAAATTVTAQERPDKQYGTDPWLVGLLTCKFMPTPNGSSGRRPGSCLAVVAWLDRKWFHVKQ